MCWNNVKWKIIEGYRFYLSVYVCYGSCLQMHFCTTLTVELVELGSIIIKYSKAETAHKMKDLCKKEICIWHRQSQGLKISDCGKGSCRGLTVICQDADSLAIDVPSV